jgi:hypothetical protein
MPPICAYLMVAIVRKQLNLQKSMKEILQMVSVNIFEQTTLAELIVPTVPPQGQILDDHHTRNLLWPNE